MLFGRRILLNLLVVTTVANANDIERYELPPSKAYIDICLQEARVLHPGLFAQQQLLHRHNEFWMQYLIQMDDGSEWDVLCDLATGKITREQRLLDPVP